ncbi:heme peroxidase [Chaetomium fimeti]|uniref:Peroxidase n=1 Tax=Chaetomium fimeti TaxID=1854472 RepID=A0AAE0HA06_9PEZI|nr:heme peroxidase [Chaetomium fimeti]
MKLNTLCLLTLALSSLEPTSAYPGLAQALTNLPTLPKRQTVTLLADLQTLPDTALSPAGLTIKNILLHNRAATSPQDLTTVYTPPGPLDSAACRASTCCVWKHVADTMAAAFLNPSTSHCNSLARQAVRLGFHDAGTWSQSGGSGGGGGADGSIILAPAELERTENRGFVDGIAPQMRAWYDSWHDAYGVGMADLVQMGATVASAACPLGPRVRAFVGRNDSAVAAPEGRLPPPESRDAEALVALFADKTIGVRELVALVGAHTASRQRFVDEVLSGLPQDSTPGVWDAVFYNETASEDPPLGVFRLPSDQALSRYPATQESWKVFADSVGGQTVWNDDYAAAYVRLSVLGVEHINDLTECTGVLPLHSA